MDCFSTQFCCFCHLFIVPTVTAFPVIGGGGGATDGFFSPKDVKCRIYNTLNFPRSIQVNFWALL